MIKFLGTEASLQTTYQYHFVLSVKFPQKFLEHILEKN